MSRKSARLQFRSKMQSENVDSKYPAPKRQKLDVDQETAIARRKQHFRIQNNQLPISSTVAITTAMIVPADEADSLACRQSLPLAQPNKCDDEEQSDVIHVIPSSRSLPGQFFRFSNHFREEVSCHSPLPAMDWADSHQLWGFLHKKEGLYIRNTDLFDAHPEVLAYMRAILLGWLTEVCELYRLHRETFYLAVEFIDRYLSVSKNIRSCHLQLVGITALFIASKIEEIYPPKTAEFAYVCDGAFDENMIHEYELTMMKGLGWMLSPLTPNFWIQLYLQVAAMHHHLANHRQLHCHSSSVTLFDLASAALSMELATDSSEADGADTHQMRSRVQTVGSQHESETHRDSDTDSDIERDLVDGRRGSKDIGCSKVEAEDLEERTDFVFPVFSTHHYLQVCRLMDLVIVDRHALRFKYSVLAAAALHLTTDITDICSVTGLSWCELEECVRWMQIHKDVLDKHHPKPATLKSYSGVAECDAHKIQNHYMHRAMWEEASSKSSLFFQNNNKQSSSCDDDDDDDDSQRRQASPAVPYNFVTPPRSVKKVSRETSMQQ